MKTRNTPSMRITQRLACTLAAVAILLWPCTPAHADGATFGVLTSAVPFRLELSSTNNGLAKGTVTVFYLKEGRILDVQLLSVLPLTDVTVPQNTSRIMFHVMPSPNGGTITFRLEQPEVGVNILETVQTGITYVFDVQ